jgi:hypothetical protein
MVSQWRLRTESPPFDLRMGLGPGGPLSEHIPGMGEIHGRRKDYVNRRTNLFKRSNATCRPYLGVSAKHSVPRHHYRANREPRQ